MFPIVDAPVHGINESTIYMYMYVQRRHLCMWVIHWISFEKSLCALRAEIRAFNRIENAMQKSGCKNGFPFKYKVLEAQICMDLRILQTVQCIIRRFRLQRPQHSLTCFDIAMQFLAVAMTRCLRSFQRHSNASQVLSFLCSTFEAIVEMMAGKVFSMHGKQKGREEAQGTKEWNVFSLVCRHKIKSKNKCIGNVWRGSKTENTSSFKWIFSARIFQTKIYLDNFEIETIGKWINKLRVRRNWTSVVFLVFLF